MTIPLNLRYSREHEWVSVDGNTATAGITEFAQRELGDIVYVDIPTTGKTLTAGDIFGSVEAVKAVSDLFMPVSGTITSINPKLSDEPSLVNSDPYGDGWMIKISQTEPDETAGLMTAEEYAALVL